jgi:hypothetical protein
MVIFTTEGTRNLLILFVFWLVMILINLFKSKKDQ